MTIGTRICKEKKRIINERHMHGNKKKRGRKTFVIISFEESTTDSMEHFRIHSLPIESLDLLFPQDFFCY